MAKKRIAADKPADDGGMTTVLIGDAVAVGEDTLTRVDATSLIVDHGKKTVAKGVVKSVAVAESSEGGTEFVDAYTDVAVSGADKVRIKTHEKTVEKDGVTYEVSVTKFKAVDRPNKDGETKVIENRDHKVVVREHTNDDADVLDGNVAITTFDADAIGDDSLVNVDAYALAIEDQLSQSTVMITSEVG